MNIIQKPKTFDWYIKDNLARSKWFHQCFPCVSACLWDNGTPTFRIDQQRPGHGNDFISKIYRGGCKRGNGIKEGKGGADLKLGDSAAGSLQAFQAPHVCLWETAPPLPLDRTQWRQFYSDKESVRSQRERERTCVAPGDEKTLLHRFRASPEPEQRNDAAILKPPQCWHTALHWSVHQHHHSHFIWEIF